MKITISIIIIIIIKIKKCQMNMNSVERVKEYSDIASEKYDGTSTTKTVFSINTINKKNKSKNKLSRGNNYSSNNSNDDSNNDDADDDNSELQLNEFELLNNYDNNKETKQKITMWPSTGKIEFKNICLQYNSSSTPVLK
jgi:ABC-type multidrug transport system fused ATPase/permease subunit